MLIIFFVYVRVCMRGGKVTHACALRGVCLWRLEVNLRSFTCFLDEISPWEPRLTDQARLSGKWGSGRLLSLPVQCSDCKPLLPHPWFLVLGFQVCATIPILHGHRGQHSGLYDDLYFMELHFTLLYIKFIITLLTNLPPQSSKAHFFKIKPKVLYYEHMCVCIYTVIYNYTATYVMWVLHQQK